MNLLDLLQRPNTRNFVINGVIGGVVTDTRDPEGLGRVKLELPILAGKITTEWVQVASLWAGEQHGLFFLPQKGDQALVAFENGDVDRPFVIGFLWSKTAPPPPAKKLQQDVREIRTRNGSVIRIDETAGKERIEISDQKKNSVVLDRAKNTITVDSQQDVQIRAKSQITLSAQKIVLKGRTVEVQGSQNITLQTAKLDAKGKQVSLGG